MTDGSEITKEEAINFLKELQLSLLDKRNARLKEKYLNKIKNLTNI